MVSLEASDEARQFFWKNSPFRTHQVPRVPAEGSPETSENWLFWSVWWSPSKILGLFPILTSPSPQGPRWRVFKTSENQPFWNAAKGSMWGVAWSVWPSLLKDLIFFRFDLTRSPRNSRKCLALPGVYKKWLFIIRRILLMSFTLYHRTSLGKLIYWAAFFDTTSIIRNFENSALLQVFILY